MDVEPTFKGVLQVAIVVENLDDAVRSYADDYGIGPWSIYTFDPSTVEDMVVRGERQDYAMRLAVCDIGDVQWEIIEPLDEKNIYAEFLEERGEGLHHVAFAVEDHDKTVKSQKRKGVGVLQAGTWHGLRYTYLETQDKLSAIAELYDMPEDFEWPEAEETYP